MLTGISILATHFNLMVFAFKGHKKMQLMILCYFQVRKYDSVLTIGILSELLLILHSRLRGFKTQGPKAAALPGVLLLVTFTCFPVNFRLP